MIAAWTPGKGDPDDHFYDWSTTDSLVTKILAHQMTVLGMIYDTPTWLSGSSNPHTPPSDPAKFAAFAAGRSASRSKP